MMQYNLTMCFCRKWCLHFDIFREKLSYIDYSLFNTSKHERFVRNLTCGSHILYLSYIPCFIVRSSLIIYVDEQESEKNYGNNWDVK